MFFTALERQEFKEPQKWWSGAQRPHRVPGVHRVYHRFNQTHKATNIDSSRSCVLPWCWSDRANSWTATAPPFILTNPPPTPRPLSAHTPTLLLSPCGGPSTLQSAPCASSSGVTRSHSPADQDCTCQCQAYTCCSVSDFWFWLSRWGRKCC